VNTFRAAIGLLALCAVPVMAAPLTVVGFNIDSGGASDHVISLQLKESVGVDLWGLATSGTPVTGYGGFGKGLSPAKVATSVRCSVRLAVIRGCWSSTVSPTPPPAGQAAPEGMPSAGSIYRVPQTDAVDSRPSASGESATVGDDRSKEQMLRRQEALEEEVCELRKALQEEE